MCCGRLSRRVSVHRLNGCACAHCPYEGFGCDYRLWWAAPGEERTVRSGAVAETPAASNGEGGSVALGEGSGMARVQSLSRAACASSESPSERADGSRGLAVASHEERGEGLWGSQGELGIRALTEHTLKCPHRLVKCACCCRYITLKHAHFIVPWQAQEFAFFGFLRGGESRRAREEASPEEAFFASRSSAPPQPLPLQQPHQQNALGSAWRQREASGLAPRERVFSLGCPSAASRLFASDQMDLCRRLAPQAAASLIRPLLPALRLIRRRRFLRRGQPSPRPAAAANGPLGVRCVCL